MRMSRRRAGWRAVAVMPGGPVRGTAVVGRLLMLLGRAVAVGGGAGPAARPLAVAGARGRGWRRDRRLRRPERDDGAGRQAVVVVQEREREAGDRLGHRCAGRGALRCEHRQRAPVLQRKGGPGVGMDVVAQHDQAVDLAARQIVHVAACDRGERGRRRDLAHAHGPAEQADVAHERARLGRRARTLLLGRRRLRPARADRRRVAVRAVDLGGAEGHREARPLRRRARREHRHGLGGRAHRRLAGGQRKFGRGGRRNDNRRRGKSQPQATPQSHEWTSDAFLEPHDATFRGRRRRSAHAPADSVSTPRSRSTAVRAPVRPASSMSGS